MILGTSSTSESWHAHGGDPLTVAAEQTLTIHSPLFCCSLEWVTGGAEPLAAHDTAVAPDAEQLASQLPAGSGTLKMHAQRIPVNCSAAVHDDEQNRTSEAAARGAVPVQQKFFASAPASYRHFCLYWPEDLPLYADLSLALAREEPSRTALARQGRVVFKRVESLAEQLQRCVVTLDMSVAVHQVPAKHVVISRA